jgi:USP8 dimerisation domain
MDSSHTTNAYTQQTQFQPATLLQFQPDPSQVYQNSISAPSIPPQSRAGPIPSQLQEPSRPHSILELGERVKHLLGDDPRPFKSWLRTAETARREAKGLQEQGDLESAFVEFAKAATIVLEKIPAHPDYRVLLTPTQRHNMDLVSCFLPLLSLSASPQNSCAVVNLHTSHGYVDDCAYTLCPLCFQWNAT